MEGALKILMTADTLGGVWTYTIDLCRELARYNVEIHLATMGALLNDEQSLQAEQLTNLTLYESNYKLEWMQDPWQDVEMAREWLQSIYHKVNPNIIHFNNYGQADGEWHCPVITVFHSCVQTWWQAVKGEEAPAGWEKYKETVKKAFCISDVVVAPTAAMLDQAITIYGNPAAGQVIYNGRDRKEQAHQQKENIVLSAGRVWDEAKNIKLLSGIAHKLSWPVHIAGNNTSPDGNVYEPKNVTFAGFLPEEEMQAYMARASVFVMPAKYEPFGLAVLEAANAGCALALSRIDTLQEIWGDAAVYFDPFDEEDVACVIQSLISDDDFRGEMAAKAVIRAKDFTVKKMAGGYVQLYQKLLAAKQIELKQ